MHQHDIRPDFRKYIPHFLQKGRDDIGKILAGNTQHRLKALIRLQGQHQWRHLDGFRAGSKYR